MVLQKLKTVQIIKRTITTCILAPVVLYCIHHGGLLYDAMVLMIFCLVMYEWICIVKNAPRNNRHITKMQQYLWYVLGMVYAVLPSMALLYLQKLSYIGHDVMLWLCIIVWSTDVGGYLVGSIVGGRKIMPAISPSKTWSGVGGALLFAIIAHVLLQYAEVLFGTLPLAVLISIVAQIGDFLESAFKRYFKVKDSGNIIPGHGGIMDRVDGLVLSAVFLAICFKMV